jgi:hypothetical protein
MYLIRVLSLFFIFIYYIFVIQKKNVSHLNLHIDIDV